MRSIQIYFALTDKINSQYSIAIDLRFFIYRNSL